MVTRPLTQDEIAACNFKTNQVITDTRIPRHYYCLLPDNRVQIGARSAISGKNAPEKKYEDMLRAILTSKIPLSIRSKSIICGGGGWMLAATTWCQESISRIQSNPYSTH